MWPIRLVPPKKENSMNMSGSVSLSWPEIQKLAHARDVAVEAAFQAAHIIRLNAGIIDNDDIREKGLHDLVTEIDEESQRVIIDVLKSSFPDHTFLAEEGDIAKLREHNTDDYRWIIDPIDGTTNFTRGIPPYAVSIGLQKGDQILTGVILDVSRNELFTAIRGSGFFVNGRRSTVSQTSSIGESIITTGFPYRSFGHVDEYLTAMRRFMREARALRRPGSASVDLAYVAAGRFDGFFETGLMAWDVAAGILMVEEAGGRVTDYRNRSNPIFSEQIVASNGLIHDAMLDFVAPLRDADQYAE